MVSVVAVLASAFSIDGLANAASGKGSGGNPSNNAPTVTGVTPNVGPAAGGTSVTINGSNLSGATAVKFGATNATLAAACTATQCRVSSPPGMNRIDVTVTTPNGTSPTDSKDRFTYQPRLTSVDPTHGPASGNTAVAIKGEGLAPGATTLAFGSTAVTAIVSCAVDGKSCTTRTPAGTGTTNVVATVSGQTSNGLPFVYDAATSPAATLSVSPTSLVFGSVNVTTPPNPTPTQTVTLRNSGAAALQVSAIRLVDTATGFGLAGGSCAVPGTLASGASCSIDVGFKPTTAGNKSTDLQVQAGGTSSTVALTGTGTESDAPTLTDITPRTGPAFGGTGVTVSGTGFAATGTVITIGGVEATSVSCASNTSCTATTPSGVLGSQPVAVRVANQLAAAGAPVNFTFEAPPVNGTVTAAGKLAADEGNIVPTLYKDSAGRRLELCIDPTQGGKCLAVAPDSGKPLSIASGNFPGESFYWNATAQLNPDGGRATLVLATEVAFPGPTGVAAGNQTVFNRVRVTISAAAPNTTYTITHPYGVLTVTTDARGNGRSTIADVGCAVPCTAQSIAALNSAIGPYLTWTSGTPAGYVGDPTVDHAVTGSPVGQNVFRIERANATGTGVTRVQTDQFAVQGRIATPKASVKGGVYNASQSVLLRPSEPASTIFYTTNGSNPTTASSIADPSTPLAIDRSTALKFVERYADGALSPTVTEQYTIELPKQTPTITDLTPKEGPAFGGTPVEITGANFSTSPGATVVKFGSDSVPAQQIACDTDTHCMVISPGGPVGTVDVTVTVAGQVSALNPAARFTYAEVVNKGSVSPGPIDPSNGYPAEYRDSRGLRLELCLDTTSGRCLAELPNPDQQLEFPFNFPDEAFWWNAGAEMTGIGTDRGGRARLVLATESAFLNGVVPGQQIAFDRIRIRVDHLVAGAEYTVTHPYGVEKFSADSKGTINTTVDLGCLSVPCSFTSPLGPNPDPQGTSVGPWLRWDTGAPAGYIGDGLTEHAITGSPIG